MKYCLRGGGRGAARSYDFFLGGFAAPGAQRGNREHSEEIGCAARQEGWERGQLGWESAQSLEVRSEVRGCAARHEAAQRKLRSDTKIIIKASSPL